MSATDDAIAYAQAHRDTFLTELTEFLAIPSVSTLAEHAGDIQRTAEWLAAQLESTGMNEVAIMPTGGHPVVYGEWLNAPGKPTVLIYGHYDVQPADPLDEWETPPFEPTVRGEYIIARGASDMKSQLFAFLKALESIVKQGEPPVNLKFVLEGEEEVGSPNLEGFLREHAKKLDADVVLNCDSAIFAPDQPSLVYSLRGLSYFEVHVQGARQDLHSGMFGGVLHNPAQVLCELIAAMHDDEGRVTLPGFYDTVRPLSDDERAELEKSAKSDERWLEMSGAPALYGESGFTPTERAGARPTLDVNGMISGFTGEGSKTVLPAKAMAKISCRLVADQDPSEVAKQLKEFIRERAPETVTCKVLQHAGAPPGFTDQQTPWMKHAEAAMEEVFGKAPLFTRQGGTIPIVGYMKTVLGINSVLMGFGLPDDGIHGPNERQYIPNLHKGIETYIRYLDRISQ